MTTQLLHGDCRDLLPTLPSASVQCVITSPPYFQARVEALGGLYILARGKADVRAALVQRFGEAVVKGWGR